MMRASREPGTTSRTFSRTVKPFRTGSDTVVVDVGIHQTESGKTVGDLVLKDLLENTIILLDPSMNPDGHQRFSQWANSNKNQSLNPDSNDREYNQYWPRARTNHYWFDLNRDYYPNQLIESNLMIQSYTELLTNIIVKRKLYFSRLS